jgi:flavorubredoxin
MKSTVVYEGKGYRWIVFGRDANRPTEVADTNQYMIVSNDEAVLVNPGGAKLFSSMLSSVAEFISPKYIKDIFVSHQDPDVVSSLELWSEVLSDCTLHASRLWDGYLQHYSIDSMAFKGISDRGGVLTKKYYSLEYFPAHYMHSPGNFHLFDPRAKILMCGMVGSSFEQHTSDFFVDNTRDKFNKMESFHKRWFPSNTAKNDWVSRVRQLDLNMLCPQHGSIYKGEQVKLFLDWFESLNVGDSYQM